MKLPKVIMIMGTLSFITLIAYLVYVNNDFNSSSKRIKIGVNEWAGYSPVIYAKLTGMFDKNDLPIDIIYMPGQSESNSNFVKGNTQGLGAVLSDIVLMRSSGIKVKVLTITDYSESGDVIVANKNIKSMKELKGKTIGIDSLNSFSHMYVLEALKNNGINENEVNFKIIPYSKASDAITNHLVDAAHTWNPGKTQAINAGHVIISKAGDIPGLILDTFSFNETFLEKNPTFAKKFIDIFYKAQELMIKDPIKSSELIKSFYNNNPIEHAQSFKDIHFVTYNEYLNINSNKTLLGILKTYEKFYLERGQLSDPNANKSILYGVTGL